MKKYLIILLCLTFSSIGYAGSKKKIDSFEGMNSYEEDGVIIIDYNPGANQKKMRREAEIAHQKAQRRERAIIRQNRIEKEREEQRARIRSYKQKPQSSSYNSSTKKRKTNAQRTESFYKKRLRGVEQERIDHVGTYSKHKRDSFERRENRYKQKIKDAQDHPEDY